MKRKLVAVIVLAAVGVGALVVASGGIDVSQAAETEYLTSPATRGDVTDDIAATGTLQPETRHGVPFGADPYLVAEDVDAPVPESTYPVTDVSVQVGDTVAAGDPLATADTTELERKLAAATNDLRSAEVSLRAAVDDLEEAEDDDVTSVIRQAKIAKYNAENQVATAEQDVADLEAAIAAATLTAPVDGIVSEVNVTAGFDAPAGAAVVIDSTTYQVTTDVVESDLAEVELGQEASVSVSAIDTVLTGTVTGISPVAGDDSSGVVSYPVTITLTDVPAIARAGMSADVTVTTASALGVVTVPAAALRGTDGAYSVLTLDASGAPVPTAVEVGLVTNSAAEITSGIDEGTEVVIGTTADLAGTDDGGTFGPGAIPGGNVVGIPGGGRGPIVREGPVFETKP